MFVFTSRIKKPLELMLQRLFCYKSRTKIIRKIIRTASRFWLDDLKIFYKYLIGSKVLAALNPSRRSLQESQCPQA